MQLSNLKIALERYSSAQAIQLGFAVGRHFYTPLLLAHLMALLPILLVLGLLCWAFDLSISLTGFTLIYWGGLPFYERVSLWCLSRLIFSERLSRRDYLDALNLARQYSLWRVLISRNSSRSFLAPVALLEQLTGTAAQTRQAHLCRTTNGTLLTFGFFGLQLVLGVNLLLLGYLLTPEEWWTATREAGQVWHYLMISTVLANLFLTPFYVSTGFTLYLAQRINVEGWDIEIKFKLLVERLKKAAQHLLGLSAIAVVLGILYSATPVAQAAAAQLTTHADDQQLLQDIVSQPDLNPYERKSQLKYVGPSWEYKPKEQPEVTPFSFGNATTLAAVFRVLLIIALIGGIVWLLYRYRAHLYLPQASARTPPPAVLFGLDVRQSVDAQDLLQQAQLAFAEGDLLLALSLLYRGALIDLIHRQSLVIRESDTEGDCLRLVQEHCTAQTSRFFKDLTHLWLSSVYAHQPIDPVKLAQLLRVWPLHFLAGAAE